MRGSISRRISMLDRPQAVERKIPDYLKEDLLTAFTLYETNESEGITLSQAQSILWNFGFWKLTKHEFDLELIENNINPQKPKLTWNELLGIVTKKYNKTGRHDKIKEIFEILDTKSRGTASLFEIQQVFKEHLEVPVSDNEIKEIFQGGDSKDLTSLTFKDFMEL